MIDSWIAEWMPSSLDSGLWGCNAVSMFQQVPDHASNQGPGSLESYDVL